MFVGGREGGEEAASSSSKAGKSSCFVVDLDHEIGVYYGLLSEARDYSLKL